MSLQKLGIYPRATAAVLIGKATKYGLDNYEIRMGDVLRLGKLYELSLNFLPVDGTVNLSFEADLGRSRTELSAFVSGRHFDIEETIGRVYVSNYTARVTFDAIPTNMEDCRLLFAV